MSSLRLLFAVMVVVCAIHATAAVKCQNCASTIDAKCKDPYEGDFEKQCPGEFCTKAVSKAGDLETVARSCGLYCTKEGSDTAGGSGVYCCKGDNCNSATAAIPALLTVLLSSLLLLTLI